MKKEVERNMRLLQLLSQSFPTEAAAGTEIINLEAILNLPKPTEHFVADIHGEHEVVVRPTEALTDTYACTEELDVFVWVIVVLVVVVTVVITAVTTHVVVIIGHPTLVIVVGIDVCLL